MTSCTTNTTLNLNGKPTIFSPSPIPNHHPSPRFSLVLRLRLKHERLYNRHRFIPNAHFAEAQEFPLLPFPIHEVLVPSERKTLHLYEARYLALLDESLFGKKKHFVHFVLDPIGISDTAKASFAARYGCLVLIEKIERLDVGALVSIRGIGRVKIVKFLEADPYLKGTVIPMQDVVPDSVSKVSSFSMELVEALHCLNSLEIKLKASKEALLQTEIANSLKWAEKEFSLDCYGAFFPSFSERLSFAALQPVSGN
ncbi:uncharacterized protein LOC130786643 isoform X3 [Actinidia eriantha]|uniref:uncharacterized protein LOC130786643 isoform X3 n=1 Tax=Actinidia eriantha TaxID=165200 RepID=UPI002588B0DB|nr:uncharacterized protein LOC130786643 isoform X3 [Actinidia eriantha]